MGLSTRKIACGNRGVRAMGMLDPITRGTMSSIPQWPKPPRLVVNTDSVDLVRYYMRLACACTQDGSPTTLANQLGVTPNTVHLAKHRGRCSHDLAIRIEKLFGPELFPRELFNPEPELPVE